MASAPAIGPNHSGRGSVGVNFQTDAFVYGAEADFDGSWIHGGSSNAFCGTNVGFPAGNAIPRAFSSL
jgi:hypothetical protein